VVVVVPSFLFVLIMRVFHILLFHYAHCILYIYYQFQLTTKIFNLCFDFDFDFNLILVSALLIVYLLKLLSVFGLGTWFGL